MSAQATRADLRLGRWQDVLADVECDSLIGDPPFGERTHTGHNAVNAVQSFERPIEYDHWTRDDVFEFIRSWSPRTRGWIVQHTSHCLIPAWEEALAEQGRATYMIDHPSTPRYTFAPLVYLDEGKAPRVVGDGPASWLNMIIVSRPKSGAWIAGSDGERCPRSARAGAGARMVATTRASASSRSPTSGRCQSPSACGARAWQRACVTRCCALDTRTATLTCSASTARHATQPCATSTPKRRTFTGLGSTLTGAPTARLTPAASSEPMYPPSGGASASPPARLRPGWLGGRLDTMSTVDKIALMVTASCSIILVLVVVSPLLTGRPLTEGKARMVAGLVDSFMALIAVYMGSRVRPKDPPNEIS